MAEISEKPGYWAVLPAQVRYDPAIPPSAKLLYSEVSSLTDQKGYCYASNAYFEALYELSERTISRLLKTLEDSGYIRIENGNGGRDCRKIYAGINPLGNIDKNVGVDRNIDKNVYPTPTKMSIPPDKNVGGIDNKKENKKEDQIPPKPPEGEGAEDAPDEEAPKRTRKAKTAVRWKPDRFEAFWKFYPAVHGERPAKGRAMSTWDRLRLDDHAIDDMARYLQKKKCSEPWNRGIGIPYASSFLNQRMWETEQAAEGTAAAVGGGWAEDPERL